MSGDAMGRELALPGQTYEDFIKKTNDIAYMRDHLSALEEEVMMTEAQRLKGIIMEGQTAFAQLSALLGSNQSAHDFLKGTYKWVPPEFRPPQQQPRQQQQVPVNQAYRQGARYPVASTSRIQELPPQPPTQGPRSSQQFSQVNPHPVRTPHGWDANPPINSFPNSLAAPPLPHRNVGALRPNTAQQNPAQFASPANNNSSSSLSAAIPSAADSSAKLTTIEVPWSTIPASSPLAAAIVRVRSTGKSEVYEGYTIANGVNSVTMSRSGWVYNVPLSIEALKPYSWEGYWVIEVKVGDGPSRALAMNTPGLLEVINRVLGSGGRELFMGYTIAKDEHNGITITKDDYLVRLVPQPGVRPSSRTPQPLPQAVAPAAAPDARSSHDLSYSTLPSSRTPQPLTQIVAPAAALDTRSSHDLSHISITPTPATNGHVNSDMRPSHQNQNSIPVPVPISQPPAPQLNKSTPLSIPSVSSLPTTQPVPAITNPPPFVSQPVPSVAEIVPKQAPPVSQQAPPVSQQAPPVSQQAPPVSQQAPPVSQPAPSVPSPTLLSLEVPAAPRSSSVTSDSPSRLTRAPDSKTLAQDVMRALGKKRAREEASSTEPDTPANKKYAPNKADLLANSVNRSSTPLSSKPPQGITRWGTLSTATTASAATPSTVANPMAAAHSLSYYRPAVFAKSLNGTATPSSSKAPHGATSAAIADSASRSATPSEAATSNSLATAITQSFSHYQPSTKSFSTLTASGQDGTSSQPTSSQLNPANSAQQYSQLVTQQPQSVAQVTQQLASSVVQQQNSSKSQSSYYRPFYAAPVEVQQLGGKQGVSVSTTMTPSPAKNQDATPLFLDSPDSPLPSYADSTQRRETPSAKALGKRKLAGVMLPPPPQWVRDDQERRRRLKTKENEKVDEAEEEEEVKELTKLAVHGALFMSTGDADEENALEIVQTRLRTMKCKWGKCDGILNSAQRAYRHLLSHGEASDETFTCQWDGCRAKLKSSSEWQVHAGSHTLQPILCAYESCEESYSDALSYINHSLERHRNHELRLSSNPVMPVASVDLANIPSSLPSYRSVHRSISQYPISAERHATLGVWVLKNITGDVDLPDKRKELPTGAELRERHKYDYLDEVARPSINPSKGVQFREMDDLDTGLATRLFHEGLVLWPGQAMLDEEEKRVKKEEAEMNLVKIEKEPIREEARTREVDDGAGSSRAFPMVID